MPTKDRLATLPQEARLRGHARAVGRNDAASGRRTASASSCSATGPSRLHYDFRLEVDGVLRQLGGAEGPDARPDVQAPGGARRGPPARLLRLRGRDPRAASTAAATSSCGTGARGRSPRATTRVAGDRGRRPPLRPRRREAAAAASSLVRRGRARRQGAVAAAAQARRRTRSTGGTPRTTRGR